MRVILVFVAHSVGTVALLVTGVLIGVNILGRSTITISDWYMLPVFWFLVLLSRLVMVLILSPALAYYGYNITRKEIAVLVYGGIKGGVPLTLSMMVAVDPELALINKRMV